MSDINAFAHSFKANLPTLDYTTSCKTRENGVWWWLKSQQDNLSFTPLNVWYTTAYFLINENVYKWEKIVSDSVTESVLSW